MILIPQGAASATGNDATLDYCNGGNDDCNYDGYCEDLSKDDMNCGECGNVCGFSTSCSGGSCQT